MNPSEILNRKVKEVLFPIDEIVLNYQNNVRDETDPTKYIVPSLQEDIKLNGQLTPIYLKKKTGEKTADPLQGFTRATVLKNLRAMGAIDPRTGKVFEHARAFVYEDLTAVEEAILIFDEGNRRSLNKYELFKAVEKLADAGLNRDQIIVASAGLLDQHYPPKRIATDEEDLKKMRRGVMDNMLRPHEGPEVLRAEYIKTLKGEQRWPRQDEVRKLVKIYLDEVKEDQTGKLNRHNPGPKFMLEWNELLAKETAAAAVGQKTKSSAMMSQQDVKDLKDKVFNSRIGKLFAAYILRKREQKEIPVFDKAVYDFETGKSTLAEFTQILDTLTAVPASDEVAKEDVKEDAAK